MPVLVLDLVPISLQNLPLGMFLECQIYIRKPETVDSDVQESSTGLLAGYSFLCERQTADEKLIKRLSKIIFPENEIYIDRGYVISEMFDKGHFLGYNEFEVESIRNNQNPWERRKKRHAPPPPSSLYEKADPKQKNKETKKQSPAYGKHPSGQAALPTDAKCPTGQAVSPWDAKAPTGQAVSPWDAKAPTGAKEQLQYVKHPTGQAVLPTDAKCPTGQAVSPWDAKAPTGAKEQVQYVKHPTGQAVLPWDAKAPTSVKEQVQYVKHPTGQAVLPWDAKAPTSVKEQVQYAEQEKRAKEQIQYAEWEKRPKEQVQYAERVKRAKEQIQYAEWEKRPKEQVQRVPFEETKRRYETITVSAKELLGGISSKGTFCNVQKKVISLDIQKMVNCSDATSIVQMINRPRAATDYLHTHSLSVAGINGLIGRFLDFSRVEQNDLIIVGLLHDIGKLKLKQELFYKPQQLLTADELKEVHKHPFLTAQMLLESRMESKVILEGVSQHHEKLNGTGYPLGLNARQICEFAKITAVSDAYDNMVTKHGYYIEPPPPFVILHDFAQCGYSELDIKYVNLFIDFMIQELKGKSIIMSNGKEGIVRFINKRKLQYPLVEVGGETITTDDKLYCAAYWET